MALFGTIQTLSSILLTSRSATRTLEAWCGENKLATDPTITAIRDLSILKEPLPSQETLEHLGATASEVAYRQVRLCCKGIVMSQAENWYVPSRLTDEMNAQLTTTTIPFGKVVSPFRPFRIPLSAALLWKDLLPEQWHLMPPEELYQWSYEQPMPPYDPNQNLFEHQALLVHDSSLPIAEVHEKYKMSLLGSQIGIQMQ